MMTTKKILILSSTNLSIAMRLFLVTGDNFGSGSSREHAGMGIEDYGFRCVIAGSFFRYPL